MSTTALLLCALLGSRLGHATVAVDATGWYLAMGRVASGPPAVSAKLGRAFVAFNLPHRLHAVDLGSQLAKEGVAWTTALGGGSAFDGDLTRVALDDVRGFVQRRLLVSRAGVRACVRARARARACVCVCAWRARLCVCVCARVEADSMAAIRRLRSCARLAGGVQIASLLRAVAARTRQSCCCGTVSRKAPLPARCRAGAVWLVATALGTGGASHPRQRPASSAAERSRFHRADAVKKQRPRVPRHDARL